MNVSYGKTAPSGQRSLHLPRSLKGNSRVSAPAYNCTDTTLVKFVTGLTSYQYLSRSAFPSLAPFFFKGPGLISLIQRASALLLLTRGSRIHLHKNDLKSVGVLL